MPLLLLVVPDRPPWGLVAVALDQPGAVVVLDEAGHGLAELVDGVVQLGPQALLVEGADPPLGATIGLRLAQEGGVGGDAEPGDRARQCPERYCGPRSGRNDSHEPHRRPADPAVDDRLIDGLEGGEAVADFGHVRPGLGGVVVDAGDHPHPAVAAGPGHGGIGAQRWFGPSGMIVPSWGRGRRRPRTRWGPTVLPGEAVAAPACH